MYKGLLKVTVVFLLFSANVYADYKSLVGTWTGRVSGQEFSCTPPDVDGPFSIDLAVEFSNQSEGHFDVRYSGTNLDEGDSFEGTGEGNFATADNFAFTVTEADGSSVSFASSFSNENTFTFVLSGNSSTCLVAATGSLSRSSTELIVDPTVTSSSTVTEAVLFNTQIQGTISDVSSHISGALSGIRFSGGPRVTDNQLKIGGTTGLNAGDGLTIPYGVWGSYSYTDYENDLSSTAFDGTNHSFLGGIDFGFWDNTVLGVALGYDSGDIDTTFNLGNQQTDSYTIAPYFGALLTDSLSIDFAVGYSKVEYDQFRTLAATRITSSPDADRWFGALNLNAVTYYDKWIIGGRIGGSFASSQIDSYSESNGSVVADSRTRLSTVSIATDVAYSYGDYEPFLNLSYQNDFQLREVSVTTGPQPSNDTDDILMTTGVRYFNKYGVSGNLEYSKRFLRDDFDEDRVSITIRADY